MKAEVLFPEVCNLYGDLMNVEYLQRCCPELEVVYTHLGDTPCFAGEKPALVYMGSATEKGQELAAEALLPYQARLMQLVGKGCVFLLTGNALEVFGSRIECEDGRVIPCLGLYATVAKRQMLRRYNAPYLGTFRDTRVVGYKSQFSHSYGNNERFPLFRTERGDGLHPGTAAEGIRVNNLMATYLLGPLTVLNPDFTRYLLQLMGAEDPHPAFEEASRQAYEFRLREFLSPEQKY